MNGNGVILVKRRKMNGEIQKRTPGRRSPDWEYGYLTADRHFREGEPPAGAANEDNVFTTSLAGVISKRRSSEKSSLMSDVDRVVDKEVRRRLLRARDAAMAAFDKALA